MRLLLFLTIGYLAYKALGFLGLSAGRAKSRSEPEEEKTKPPSRETSYYIASTRSTKFHLAGCRRTGRISQENRITFKTREEALEAGYEPASDCTP